MANFLDYALYRQPEQKADSTQLEYNAKTVLEAATLRIEEINKWLPAVVENDKKNLEEYRERKRKESEEEKERRAKEIAWDERHRGVWFAGENPHKRSLLDTYPWYPEYGPYEAARGPKDRINDLGRIITLAKSNPERFLISNEIAEKIFIPYPEIKV